MTHLLDSGPDALPDADVHVWFASICEHRRLLPELNSLLSDSERARAERFAFQGLRDAYVIRHGLLRTILAEYLHTAPGEIRFQYGRAGKPAVCGSRLSFSHSHSGDLALFAIGTTGLLGLDVEQVRPIPELDEFARHYFSHSESDTLLALPPECRLGAFFAFWTKKEAVLKAMGEGIGNWSRVEISRDDQREILRIESEDAGDWRLLPFTPVPGYAAAIAVKQAELRLQCRALPAHFANAALSCSELLPASVSEVLAL
jgi:4'-phosphopantetheinyl transferase